MSQDQSKFYVTATFTGTGTIGIAPYFVGKESKLSVVVTGVGGGNVITVQGRIRGATTYNTLATITGAVTTGTEVDISAIDEIKFDCGTYSASGTPTLVASGFFFLVSSFPSNVSVGGNLTVAGNLSVSGNFQFGDASVDTLTAYGPVVMRNDINLAFGTTIAAGTASIFQYDTAETVDCLKLGLDETSRRFVICDYGDIDTDTTLAAATTPTLTIFAAAFAATKYWSITHDGTNSIYVSGAGSHFFYVSGGFKAGITNNYFYVANDIQLSLGTSQAAATASAFEFDTSETVDCLKLGLDETSRRFMILDYSDVSTNSALSAATNPTLSIFAAAYSAAKRLDIYHDGSNAGISSATGYVAIIAPDASAVRVSSNAFLQCVGTASGYFIIENAADASGFQIRPHVTTQTASAGFSVLNNVFGTSTSASSGTQTFVNFSNTINQSGTAGYDMFSMTVTETSTGSGTKRLLSFTVGATTVLSVLNTGKLVGNSTDSGSVDFATAADHHILIGGGGGLQLRSSSTFLRENVGIEIAAATSKGAYINGRFQTKQGADVASANDLTLGSDGSVFEITGTTQINAITTTNYQNGAIITLLFTSTPLVKHNTAGGASTAVMLLAGAADFSATAGDTLTLVYSEIGGTNAWREIARSVI